MRPAAFMALLAGLVVVMTAAAAGRPAARRSDPTPRPVGADRALPRRPPVDLELDQAIETLDGLARDLRAGASFAAALPQALAGHPAVLSGLRVALQRGAPVVDATARAAAEVARHHPSDATDALVLQALRAAHAAGGNGVDALDRAAAVLRERRAWRNERRAQSAQARLSARLLTVLPPAFAIWGLVADPRVRATYAASPLPAVCVVCGLTLNLVGWWWMRRLVRGDR